MVEVEEVRKVASNARLELDEEEAESFGREMDEVLDVFDSLSSVDTEDVEPSFHPIDVEPESREDEVEETLDREQVFRNTGNEEEGMFRGPSV